MNTVNMIKLTEKQENFCEEYVKNGYKIGAAYEVAYDNKNKNVVSVEGNRLLKDPRIRERIKEVEFDYYTIGHTKGLTKELIVNVLLRMMEAKKPIVVNGVVTGETEDYIAQNNAITTFAKLTGDFAPEKKKITLDSDEFSNIDVSKLDQKQLEELKASILSSI